MPTPKPTINAGSHIRVMGLSFISNVLLSLPKDNVPVRYIQLTSRYPVPLPRWTKQHSIHINSPSFVGEYPGGVQGEGFKGRGSRGGVQGEGFKGRGSREGFKGGVQGEGARGELIKWEHGPMPPPLNTPPVGYT